jgi:hypothetical protein
VIERVKNYWIGENAMKKTDLNHPSGYFDRYISQVAEDDLDEAFARSVKEIDALDPDVLKRFAETGYEPGKWSIKEIFQHLIDCERIMAYRALRIGRNEPTPLPGFDQDILAANVNANGRPMDTLVEEMKIVRRGTALMFTTFDEASALRLGLVSDRQMSALAFGFAIVGHQNHHFRIIRENYKLA